MLERESDRQISPADVDHPMCPLASHEQAAMATQVRVRTYLDLV